VGKISLQEVIFMQTKKSKNRMIAILILAFGVFFGYQIFIRNSSVDALSKYGSRAEEVRQIQTKLKRWGYYKGNVDGIYGSQTLEAVKYFQRKNGLTVDGIVGNNTWKYLLTLPPYPTMRQGAKGSYVTLLQRLFESNLIPVGTIDGDFGTRTTNAVKTFQQNNNLTVDGIVGNNTWAKLTQPI